MKELNRKEIILLAAPVLLLASLGFTLLPTVPPLIYEKAEIVTHIPPTQAWFFQPGIYTEARIYVKHNPPLLYKILGRGPRWRMEDSAGYLIDNKGRKYINFKSEYIKWKGVPFYTTAYLGQQRYYICYALPLSQVPQSAGKLTLKAQIVIDDGFRLPVSVVVRDK